MTAPPPAVRRSPYRWFIGVGLALILILGAARLFIAPPGEKSDLRRYCVLPPFSLTESSGRTITNQDLYGKIWVADFVYTTCPGPCPLVTASLAQVGKETANDPKVQLVTITVDPENDTPAVLGAYATKFGADRNKWWFLTGPEKQVYSLIKDGFWQAVENNREATPPQPGSFTVSHSTYFVLVDQAGTTRGFFDGTDAAARTELLKAIKILENESP